MLSLLQTTALSRLVVLLIAVVSDLIIPDHVAEGVLSYTFADNCRLAPLLQSFSRWDSAHFLNIAQHGWQDEWNHAFFPIYPLTMYARTMPPMQLGLRVQLGFL